MGFTSNDPLPEQFVDNFGRQIALGVRNDADISAEYRFSPERWRLERNGSREYLQYGSSPVYSKPDDHHILSPAQGDVVALRTAERFRYSVGLVIVPSWAFGLSRSLESGDKVVVGYGDPDLNNDMASADGWFLIFDDEIADNEVKLTEYRDGTVVDGPRVVQMNNGITSWRRVQMDVNWYNVGNAKVMETSTSDGEQNNRLIGALSVDEGRGPKHGNQWVGTWVKRGSSSSALEVDMGSIAVQTIGEGTNINRQKVGQHEHTFATTGAWVPILAMRRDDQSVNTQLSELDITGWGGNSDVELLVKAHGQEKVLNGNGNPIPDSEYSTPELQSPINSALEVATTVNEGPRQSDGTTQTSITDSGGPGGIQIGVEVSRESKAGVGEPDVGIAKRGFRGDEVAVVWGRAGTADTINFQYTIDQNW